MFCRSPQFLLRSVEEFCAALPGVRDRLEIVFAGRALPEDRQLVDHSSVGDLVRWIGQVSHAQSIELIRTADLLFLPMHNLPSGRRATTVQAKTYEYMAAGRPILAAVPEGDANDYLAKSGSALICRPDDVPGMRQNIQTAYFAWEKGRQIIHPELSFIAQFERKALTHLLAAQFKKILNPLVGETSPADQVGITYSSIEL
jgi:glycosyltransferase involved in cell wall biosynthesis